MGFLADEPIEVAALKREPVAEDRNSTTYLDRAFLTAFILSTTDENGLTATVHQRELSIAALASPAAPHLGTLMDELAAGKAPGRRVACAFLMDRVVRHWVSVQSMRARVGVYFTRKIGDNVYMTFTGDALLVADPGTENEVYREWVADVQKENS